VRRAGGGFVGAVADPRGGGKGEHKTGRPRAGGGGRRRALGWAGGVGAGVAARPAGEARQAGQRRGAVAGEVLLQQAQGVGVLQLLRGPGAGGVLRGCPAGGGRVGLSLSGGLDSRAILAVLAAEKYPVCL